MKLMNYADDTIWILFGLGVAMIAGVLVWFVIYGEFGWASAGFLGTGILVSLSYILVGSYPPRSE